MYTKDFFTTFLADALPPAPAFTDVCKSGFGFDNGKKTWADSTDGSCVTSEAGCDMTITYKDEAQFSLYEEIVFHVLEEETTDNRNGGEEDGPLAFNSIQEGVDWDMDPPADSLLFRVGWGLGGLSPFACVYRESG